MHSSLLTLLLPAIFLGFAQTKGDREDVLLLRNGQSLVCEIQSSTPETVTIKYGREGQGATATLRAADLDPQSFYSVREGVTDASAKDILALAKFAADNRMFVEATAQYNRAKVMDPELVGAFEKTELPRYLDDLASRLVADARDALSAGDIEAARSLTQDVLTRLSTTKAADDAKKLAKEIGEKSAQKAIETAKAETGKRACTGDESCLIALKNGKSITGKVVESTDDSVTFTFKSNGTDVTSTLRARELEPSSFYAIRSASLTDSATDHLALAKYIADQGMYAQARMHYEIARSLDPAMIADFDKEELPKIKNGIAARLLASAKRNVERDKLDDAKRDLSTILTLAYETTSAPEAKTLIDNVYRELGRRSLAEASGQREQKDAAATKKFEDDQKQAFGPMLEAQERGRKLNGEGLQNTKSQTEAMQSFKSAAEQFKRGLQRLDTVEKDRGKDPDWAPVIGKYRESLTQELVDALVNAGNVALGRSAIPDAREFADQALAADPQSSYAQSFRASVEAAANSSDRWPKRWTQGRGRGRR
jgi:tetratricopeptide (TPR) repeat protein